MGDGTMTTTTTAGEVIWSATRPTGSLVEVVACGEGCGRVRLCVRVDGRERARGPLVEIDRRTPGHKNAPAGTTHLIDVSCFGAGDGAAIAAAVAPRQAALDGAARDRAEAAARGYWGRVAVIGVTRAEADAVLGRWGRDGLAAGRAHTAEAMADHAILLKLDLAGRH